MKMHVSIGWMALAFGLGVACGGATSSGGAGNGSDASVDGSGSSSGSSSGGSSGSDSGSTSGDAGVCSIDPPGAAFTFHVHNGGSSDLGLAFGCGSDAPIVLTTPAGSLGIGSESANACGFTCDDAYKGDFNQQACSDCGPGVGKDLPAGGTVDIAWDRRVYAAHTAAPSCVGGMTGVSCALAVEVAPSASQQGTLSVCTAGASSGGGSWDGFCGGSKAVPFTLDLTQSAGTIEVQ